MEQLPPRAVIRAAAAGARRRPRRRRRRRRRARPAPASPRARVADERRRRCGSRSSSLCSRTRVASPPAPDRRARHRRRARRALPSLGGESTAPAPPTKPSSASARARGDGRHLAASSPPSPPTPRDWLTTAPSRWRSRRARALDAASAAAAPAAKRRRPRGAATRRGSSASSRRWAHLDGGAARRRRRLQFALRRDAERRDELREPLTGAEPAPAANAEAAGCKLRFCVHSCFLHTRRRSPPRLSMVTLTLSLTALLDFEQTWTAHAAADTSHCTSQGPAAQTVRFRARKRPRRSRQDPQHRCAGVRRPRNRPGRLAGGYGVRGPLLWLGGSGWNRRRRRHLLTGLQNLQLPGVGDHDVCRRGVVGRRGAGRVFGRDGARRRRLGRRRWCSALASRSASSPAAGRCCRASGSRQARRGARRRSGTCAARGVGAGGDGGAGAAGRVPRRARLGDAARRARRGDGAQHRSRRP